MFAGQSVIIFEPPGKTTNPNPSPTGVKFGFVLFGTPKGTRTPDLLIRRQLYQLFHLILYQFCTVLYYFCKFYYVSLLKILKVFSSLQQICNRVQTQKPPLRSDPEGWFTSRSLLLAVRLQALPGGLKLIETKHSRIRHKDTQQNGTDDVIPHNGDV